jgi:hypothetical protein
MVEDGALGAAAPKSWSDILTANQGRRLDGRRLIFRRPRQQPHAVESEKFNSMLLECPPDYILIAHLHCECTVNSLAS